MDEVQFLCDYTLTSFAKPGLARLRLLATHCLLASWSALPPKGDGRGKAFHSLCSPLYTGLSEGLRPGSALASLRAAGKNSGDVELS